jgi:carbonic anhydrase/acetyltransferase-like protein (isoleucine patch superfamily)
VNNIVNAENTSIFRSSCLTFFNEKSHSRVEIGANSLIHNCNINMGYKSTLIIGADCCITGRIKIGYKSEILLGDRLKVTENLCLGAVESTKLTVEEDCLFGSNIIIRTYDGHQHNIGTLI